MSEQEEERPYAYLAVASEANAVGVYTCVLSLGEERLRVLNREAALAYATEVTWAITCAEYDAAVLAQLMAVKDMDMGAVRYVVQGIRRDRRPVLSAATHPLTFEAIVSHRDKVARVNVKHGEAWWTWDLDAARKHVQQVLEVSAGGDMDAVYLRYLKSAVGLDDQWARGMVGLLREHMPGLTDTSKIDPPPVDHFNGRE